MALAFGNTPKAMAPWGGKRPLYGTSPLAFAAPQRAEPIIVDMALSQVARGKILPPHRRANPSRTIGQSTTRQATTDPAAALKGALQPIGGAKGAALAMMVEVLAVALTGAQVRVRGDLVLRRGRITPRRGECSSPSIQMPSPAAAFLDRVAALARMIDVDAGARLPGSRRIALREKARVTAWRWMPSSSPRCARWRRGPEGRAPLYPSSRKPTHFAAAIRISPGTVASGWDDRWWETSGPAPGRRARPPVPRHGRRSCSFSSAPLPPSP